MLLKPFANRLTRATLAAAGTLATTLICSAAAQAGTVQIKSCGDAPAGGADTAWQIVNDNISAYQAPTAVCGRDHDFLPTSDHRNSPLR